MFIQDPVPDFYPSRIPDPGVKKAPDPDPQRCRSSNLTVFIVTGVSYEYPVLCGLDHSLFLEPAGSNPYLDSLLPPAATPQPSSLARRTKQEIRSGVKIARKYADSPLMWAKCLLATCYSLW